MIDPEKDALEILGKYKDHFRRTTDSGFKNVAANLIQRILLSDCIQDEEIGKKSELALRKYIELLDEFPEFREEQLTTNPFQGEKRFATNLENFIDEIYKKLKGKK